MAKEIELKLETSPEGADAIEASELMPSKHKTAELHATYFDTPTYALRRNGLSLRVRRSGSRYVQTVKADGAPAVGVFARKEWEVTATGGKPIADDRTPVADLLEGTLEELVPALHVPAQRKSWRISAEDAEIDVTLDCGEVRAGPRLERFCEIELELVEGTPAALFRAARQFDEVAPVRLGVLSKAERGFRLMGPLEVQSRSEDVCLNVAMTLTEAIAAIGQSCLRHYRLNENTLLRHHVSEGVHQARVALRRLRVALLLFKNILGSEDRGRFNDRLRELATTLGEARDLDVLIADLDSGPLHAHLLSAQPSARAAVQEALAARKTRMLMLELSEWLVTGDWQHDPATAVTRQMPLDQYAAASLDRLMHKLRKHGHHLAALNDEHRHRVRKDAKKLRYAAEFFGSIFHAKPRAKRYRAFLKALKRLQNDLGELNDRATAEARLCAGPANSADCVEYLSAWNQPALIEKAEGHLAALLEKKPFWH